MSLFNSTFFMSLGIIILAIAVTFAYFESKIREQNHKISSMFSIVSTLAEDMNQLKSSVNHFIHNGGSLNVVNETPLEKKLISVSDDENDSDSDEDGSVSDEDGSDSDEDVSGEDSEDSEDNEDNDDDDQTHFNCIENDEIDDLDIVDVLDELNETKVISNSEIEFETEINDIKVLKINNIESILENIDQNSDIIINELTELEETHDDQREDDEQIEETKKTEENLYLIEKDFKELKTVSINNLEESVIDYTDYKRLPLQKLKSIAVEKGLVADNSKIKKPELLKLLEVE
jgi:hypothetical protein